MKLAPFYPLARPWLSAYRRFAKFSAGETVFRILTFHDISNRNRASFDRLIRYIAENHRIMTPEEVEGILDSGRFKPSDNDAERIPCLITFDDGYESNAEVAKEILRDLGIKAIFFVCPSLVDLPRNEQAAAVSRCMFEGQKSDSECSALMSWEDLAALSEAGHTIASHTLRHRRLPGLVRKDKLEEIVRSREVLAKRLARRINWFAYPFGTIQSIDVESVQLIAGAYRYCCSGIRGINTQMTSRLTLRRDSVELDAPFEYQLLSIYGGLDFLYKGAARRLNDLATTYGR